jgi:hypothetical protein
MGGRVTMLHRGGREFKPDKIMNAVRGLRCAAITVCALTLIPAFSAVAQDAAREGSARPAITFDIPTQPLSDALYTYSSTTGIEILVPGDMLARRRSSAVAGVLTPEDALRALLSGTGLVPRYTGPGAFTLAFAVPDPSVAARIPRYPHYSAALQAAVTDVLCQLRETRPGGYRAAARLWVGPAGQVTRVGFLGTTGDADRDAALTGLLERVAIGEPPPANLPQPTIVVILPRQDAAECMIGVGRAP